MPVDAELLTNLFFGSQGIRISVSTYNLGSAWGFGCNGQHGHLHSETTSPITKNKSGTIDSIPVHKAGDNHPQPLGHLFSSSARRRWWDADHRSQRGRFCDLLWASTSFCILEMPLTKGWAAASLPKTRGPHMSPNQADERLDQSLQTWRHWITDGIDAASPAEAIGVIQYEISNLGQIVDKFPEKTNAVLTQVTRLVKLQDLLRSKLN